VTDPHLRASDADRERVVTALERHVAAGRLNLDEYAHRVDRALAATTLGELLAITGDLPREETGRPDRQLALAFLIAVIALAVIGVFLALAR
jgi:uncharacterized protein DUF1707